MSTDVVSNVWKAIGFDLKARRLTKCEAKILSRYHPEATLDDVRVHGHLPWFMVRGFSGITIGNDVYLENDRPNTVAGVSVLGHEAAHVVQQRSPMFFPRYIFGALSGMFSTGDRGKAHDSIGYEKEGIDMQRKIYTDIMRAEGPMCGCE
jgi:hypothetical protein